MFGSGSDIYSYVDFREIILAAFTDRQGRNPRYSLRAFARDLDIISSRLSQVLSGRYGLSPSEAKRIAAVLCLSDEESEYFCALVASKHARSKAERRLAEVKLNQLRQLKSNMHAKVESFQALKHWYYLPLVELVHLTNGEQSIEYYSRALNLEQAVVKQAIRELIQLEILVGEIGALRKNDRHIEFTSPTPKQAIRQFHRQILGKASEAVDTQDMKTRKSISTILTIRSEDYDAAREFMAEFDRRFVQRFETETQADRVACLVIHFFEIATVDLGEESK